MRGKTPVKGLLNDGPTSPVALARLPCPVRAPGWEKSGLLKTRVRAQNRPPVPALQTQMCIATEALSASVRDRAHWGPGRCWAGVFCLKVARSAAL